MILGYTAGVFDLFHVGHVNLLRTARGLCDRLLVGVSSDALVVYKNKAPIIPFTDRIQIVRSVRYVDAAVEQTSIDKVAAWKKLRFNVLFVGDDWYEEGMWREWEDQLSKVGVAVRYLPYTRGVSSTTINETLAYLRGQSS